MNQSAPAPVYSAREALAALLEWLPADAALTPLRPREKRPIRAGWNRDSRLLLSDPDFRDRFQGEVGIGLVCGDASGGLAMVDIDVDLAVDLIESSLPQLALAPCVRGARGAKWLVRLELGVTGHKLHHRHKAVGELLATGQQAVVAGIHPGTGEPYRWLRTGLPPMLDSETIRSIMARLA
jgi:hypothetical protein